MVCPNKKSLAKFEMSYIIQYINNATENRMTNANWMVTLANSHRKALAGFGYAAKEINAMDLKEAEQELKKLGYDFKANSPFKNK